MAQSFPQPAIPHEIAARVRAAWAQWERAPHLGRLVRDVWPQEARQVWECGRLRPDGYKVYQSKTVADKYRVAPFRCGRTPFCLPCASADAVRRTRGVLDKFKLFTPKGKPILIWHVVFTSPQLEDGQAAERMWGVQACQDVSRFARVVRRTLETWWGPSVGGIMNYQDFGNRPFSKRHAHFDVLVNGYGLRDGKPYELPRLDLEAGARDSLDEVYQGHVAAHFGLGKAAGTWNVRAVGDSWDAKRRVTAYSIREMVDLAHMIYDEDNRRVGWQAYDTGELDWTTPQGLRDWYEEYVGLVDNGQELHRWFGPMRARNPDSPVVAAYGGDSLHEETCECNDCDDWERLPPDWDQPEPTAAPPPG